MICNFYFAVWPPIGFFKNIRTYFAFVAIGVLASSAAFSDCPDPLSRLVKAKAQEISSRQVVGESEDHTDQGFRDFLSHAANKIHSESEDSIRHIVEGDWVQDHSHPLKRRLKGGLHFSPTYYQIVKEMLASVEIKDDHLRTVRAKGPQGFFTELISFHADAPGNRGIKDPEKLIQDIIVGVLEGRSLESLQKKIADSKSYEDSTQIPIFNRSHRESVEHAIQYIFQQIQRILEVFDTYGLSIHDPKDRMRYYHHQDLVDGPITELTNGVMLARFKPATIRGKTWRNLMIEAAKRGTVPLGGKSFFPPHWDESKLKLAIEYVLRNNPRILSANEDKDKNLQRAIVEGSFEEVRFRIALHRGRVISAYPSWEQGLESDAELNTYLYRIYSQQLSEVLSTISKVTQLPVVSNHDAIAIHLGKKPDSLSEGDYRRWKLFLDPASNLAEGAGIRNFGEFQDILSLVMAYGRGAQTSVSGILMMSSRLGLNSALLKAAKIED